MSAQRDPIARRLTRDGAALGVAGTALLALVYLLATRTHAGQQIEDDILSSASQSLLAGDGGNAERLLHLLSATVLAGAVAGVLLVAAVRRRLGLGLVAAGVIAATLGCTEVARRLATRPVLLAHGYRREDQSFPSGHTAIAVSIWCALLLVTPYRLRGAVMLAGSLWAAGVAAATVTVSWHRPSDTIGSGLIALVCTCVAVVGMARLGWARTAQPATRAGRVGEAALLGGYAATAVGAGAVALALLVVGHAPADPELPGPTLLHAGRALALCACAVLAGALLVLLRRTDFGPSPQVAREAGAAPRERVITR